MLPQGRIEQWEYAAHIRFYAEERRLSEEAMVHRLRELYAEC